MDRSSFLKSLFVLVASPKLLAELKTAPKPVITPGIFNDLQFVIPDYMPKLMEKYGDKSFYALMKEATESDIKKGIAIFQGFEIPRVLDQETTGASI